MPASDQRQLEQAEGTRFFVFMGVCGVGKSTVAKAVADALDGTFVEADSLHSEENVKAMSEGRPLTDEERWPWLEAVCATALAETPPVTIACSALKARYREFIRSRLPGAVFVHLTGSPEVIRERMTARTHFMSPAMLDSQLSILEPLDEGAGRHTLSIEETRNEVTEKAISICRSHLAAELQGGSEAAEASAYKNSNQGGK